MNPRSAAQNQTGWLAILLAGLFTLGPFSVDTYLPSFPAIGASLNATPLEVQQTLSVYLFSFSIMMLFHGPLADSFGRRPVVLVSLLVFTLASIGCALSRDIQHLLFFRAVQGLSAGAGMVVGRAIIRDRFSGHAAQKMMAQVAMIFGVAPAVAPIIGGWLHAWLGWRAIFVFMAVIGVTLLFFSRLYLSETLPDSGRQPLYPRALAENYLKVLRNRTFLLLSCALAFEFAALFLYIASAPVFLLQHLNLSENEFAWLFLPVVAGMMLGSYISGKLAGRISTGTAVKYAYLLQFAAVALNLFYSGWFPPAVPWAILPLTLYSIGMYLAKPGIILLILDLFPNNRGMVSSLQIFLQTMLSTLVAGLVSPSLSGSVIALAIGMAGFLLLGWGSWVLYLRRLGEQPQEAAHYRSLERSKP